MKSERGKSMPVGPVMRVVEMRQWRGQALTDVLVMAFAVTAACLLLQGCGGNKVESASSGTSDGGSGAVSAVVASATPLPTSNSSAVQPQSQPAGAEGLPPEIAIGEIDNQVLPGQPVQLEVFGTPDVTTMTLSDGLGSPKAFVHDTTGDVWRASYRVPLKPRTDRIGLSVMAQNDLGRWRRVWLFLELKQPEITSVSVADSAVVTR